MTTFTTMPGATPSCIRCTCPTTWIHVLVAQEARGYTRVIMGTWILVLELLALVRPGHVVGWRVLEVGAVRRLLGVVGEEGQGEEHVEAVEVVVGVVVVEVEEGEDVVVGEVNCAFTF